MKCRVCDVRLVPFGDGLACPLLHGDEPVYGGSLDLSQFPARCTRCDWEGCPASSGGVLSTECPACEGARGAEEAQWVALFEHPEFEPVLRCGGPLYRIKRRQPAAVPAGPKVRRNAPCPCGSGKKAKRCCAR